MEQGKENSVVQRTSLTTWKWTIKHLYRYVTPNGACIRSPPFSIQQSKQITTWRFKVYPNGINKENKNFMSISLSNLDEHDVTASYEYSLLNRINDTVIKASPSWENKIFSQSHNKTWCHDQFASQEFLKNISNYPPTDNTFVLQFCIIVDTKNSVVPNMAEHQLKNDYESLLDTGEHSDVTFSFGRKKIQLHKAILAVRSPVFGGMFEHDMKENQQSIVKITDVKYKIAKEMFRYLYAGKVNELSDIAKDLLIAADMYCIDELKMLCEKNISERLSIDNVLEYLQLATTYNAKYLKSRVYKFVTSHIKEVYVKPEFKELDSSIKDEIFGVVIGAKSVN